MSPGRGAVVEGPDPLGASAQRPWVKLSDSGHPFDGEEGVYAAVTRTRRAIAVELQRTDFDEGGLRPGPSFVSPWVLVSFKHDDMHREVGSSPTPSSTKSRRNRPGTSA